MHKKILFILLLFTVAVSAQVEIDTAIVDSLQLVEFDEYTVEMPFSASSLNKLPVVSKKVFLKEDNQFRSYFFLFLLNILAIAVMLFVISKTKVKKLITTLFSLNVLMQYAKVEIKRNNNYLWAYFILLMILLSSIIYIVGINLGFEFDVLKGFLLILLFLIIDWLVGFFSAIIFKKRELKEVCHFNNFSFVILLLPFFIVCLLVILFLNAQNTIISIFIMIAVITIIYLWKEFRNLFILKANKINVFSFYFFLYLCTFKILPMAILIKTILQELIK